MSPQTYFRIFKETIDGKEKFSLYQSDNGSNFELIHSFRFLYHAKARLLKMAGSFESYHYLIQDGDNILEQVNYQPEAQADLFADKTPTLYKKVVYRLVKHFENFYTVDCQTWLSSDKNVLNSKYNIVNIGEFPTYSQAQNALHAHASFFSSLYLYLCWLQNECSKFNCLSKSRFP